MNGHKRIEDWIEEKLRYRFNKAIAEYKRLIEAYYSDIKPAGIINGIAITGLCTTPTLKDVPNENSSTLSTRTLECLSYQNVHRISFDPESQYRCAACGLIFDLQCDEGWNDEKAEAELKENFRGVEKEDCDIVCDDCYNKYFKNLS